MVNYMRIFMLIHMIQQVTGRRTEKETGDFVTGNFRHGEYETAITLEKQDDLKTTSKSLLEREEEKQAEQKKLKAEVLIIILPVSCVICTVQRCSVTVLHLFV